MQARGMTIRLRLQRQINGDILKWLGIMRVHMHVCGWLQKVVLLTFDAFYSKIKARAHLLPSCAMSSEKMRRQCVCVRRMNE